MSQTVKAAQRVNAALCLSLALFAMCLTSISPVIAHIQKEMPALDAGLLVTLNFLGFICFAALAGTLADRYSKKTFIAAALLTYAAVLPMFALRLPQKALYGVFFLMGGCNGIIETQASAALADNNPADPDRHVNRGHVFFGFGAILAPLVVALLLSAGLHYALFYLALAVLAALLFLAVLRLRFAPASGGGQRIRQSFAALKREPLFALICLALFFYTGAEISTWAWLSSQLQFRHGFDALMSGAAVSVFWISMTLGRWICGKLAEKIRLSTLLIALGLLSGLAAFLTHFVSSVAGAAAAAVLLGLVFSSQFPFLSSYGARQTTLPSGMAFSLLMILGNLGSSVLTYAVHAARGSSGLAADLLISLSLFSVALLVYIVRRKTEA